jgi:hypothetical protein
MPTAEFISRGRANADGSKGKNEDLTKVHDE